MTKETRCVIVSVPYSVSTGPESYAEIEAPSSTGKIRVGPNSRLRFEWSNTAYIPNGKAWFRVKVRQNGEFFVKTSCASTGIRGTQLEVTVDGEDASTIRLLEGEIDVSDPDGSGTVGLQAGQEVTVTKGSPPPQPRPIDSGALDAWWDAWPKLVPIEGEPLFGTTPSDSPPLAADDSGGTAAGTTPPSGESAGDPPPPPTAPPGAGTSGQPPLSGVPPSGATMPTQVHFDFTRQPVGNEIDEISGNGLKAVLHGARWVGAKGVLFDRSDAWIEIANSPLLHGEKALTLIVDATPMSLGNQEWQSILWKGNPPDCTRYCENREYSLWLNRSGALQFNSTPESWVGRSQLYLDSKAGDYFEGGVVAAVIDTASDTMKFYVNGREAASRTYATDTIRTSEGPLTLGDVPANNNGVAFHGLVRSLRLYHRALTPAEIETVTSEIGAQRRRARESSAIRSAADLWVPDDAILRGRWACLVHMRSDTEFGKLDWATLEHGLRISDGLLAVPGATSIPLRGPTEAIYFHDGSPVTVSGIATVLDCIGPCGVGGLMEFVILGDGKELWRSGPIAQGDPAQRFSVSLASVRELHLVATDGGNGNGQDWGAWLNLEVGR